MLGIFCHQPLFQYFFHHRNSVDIRQVLKETYHLIDTTPDELNPLTFLDPFEPLTHEQYPVFNKYPKFIVDYQVSVYLSLVSGVGDYRWRLLWFCSLCGVKLTVSHKCRSVINVLI